LRTFIKRLTVTASLAIKIKEAIVVKKLNLLWVDLTISTDKAELPAGFEEFFCIRHCGRSDHIREHLESSAPDALCFDCDYPDRAILRFIQKIKQEFKSVPMIMTTIHHSEEVAVWAFRSRLVDYLVKPVSWIDLDRSATMLRVIHDAKENQGVRQITGPVSALPTEVIGSHRKAAVALMPAIYYVEKNYGQDFRNEKIAKLCGMSPYQFSRVFTREFGLSFRDFVIRYRLLKAYHLMKKSQTTVKDVAYAVGFNDISYFSRMFKRQFGVLASSIASQPLETVIDDSVIARLQLPRELVEFNPTILSSIT
jgi:AraC-like DNA-binding protein